MSAHPWTSASSSAFIPLVIGSAQRIPHLPCTGGATPDRIWESRIYVQCGAVPRPQPLAPFTTEGWIRPDTLDAHARRVFAWEHVWGGTIVAAPADGLVFSRFVKAHEEYRRDPVTWHQEIVKVAERHDTIKAPIQPGRWTHVVAAFDGTRMRLIVDGVLRGERGSSVGVGGASYVIGSNYNGYLEWDGLIDEAATYSSALTVAQAAAHHAAGS